jgi:hypothetical protein
MKKPEALRLAEVSAYLEGGERGRWIIDAAAELRRLSAVEAQRDALLEALRKIGRYTGDGPTYTTPWQDIVADLGQTARAAIKAVEETK